MAICQVSTVELNPIDSHPTRHKSCAILHSYFQFATDLSDIGNMIRKVLQLRTHGKYVKTVHSEQ